MPEAEKANFKLDPRKFNKLRLRHIEIVYGELGQQMLTMLPQRPSRVIPILCSRFTMNFTRAKMDRQELVSEWFSQCEKNF